MEMRISRLTILVLMFGIFSCNKTTPAGFWSNFQSESLKENNSDQGPYGGHKAMHWKSDKEGTFSSKEVIDFATKNGWELVDSSDYPTDILSSWSYNKKPVFPLSHTGFSSNAESNSIYEDFPRWINASVKVYSFKTGWMMVEPGTGKSNAVNGFVVLENTGKEMSVYHLWGE